MSRAFACALLALFLVALGIRCVNLGNRPFHGDEAVHAEKFEQLWKHGVYHYDSNEYHGPTIYYAALPSVILAGRHTWQETREADYRLPIAVFGALMVLALIPLAPGLGRYSTLAAALFIAISPAFVFYSRYFIQEVPFALFTLCFLAFAWRYLRTPSIKLLAITGVSAGLMIATKETAILSFAAAGVSLPAALFLTQRFDRTSGYLKTLRKELTARTLLIGISIVLLTACLFLTGFGKNLHGPLDYLRSYAPWFHRAQGSSLQNHPLFYYIQILVWYHKPHGPVFNELLIVLLAFVGVVAAFRPANLWHAEQGSPILWKFIALYTLVLTFVYSIIPYKTPWCILSFLLGMCLLAGLGVSWLLGAFVPLCDTPSKPKLAPFRVAIFLLILAVPTIQLGSQSIRDSYVAYADPHNPYVYAATAADIVNLQKRIDDLAKYWPQHKDMVIKVFATDNYYWPIPWYLRSYPNVGYYSHPARTKEEAAADVTLCNSDLDDVMSPLLDDTDLMNGMDEVRNGVFYEVFIKMDVWTTYLNGKNGGAVLRKPPPPAAE